MLIPLFVLVLFAVAPFSNAQSVPDWVKNTAGWWASDAISETEFVNAIEFLVNDGIIKVESNYTPKQLAEMWKKGQIPDKSFLDQLRTISEEKYFLSEDILDVPNWLANNAGWVSARVITNSNFNWRI